jgi:hypothetical protein
MSYVEIGIPEDYQGLSHQEKVSCLQNRQRIRTERTKKFTLDPLLENLQQMEKHFQKADPQRYLAGLKLVLGILEQMEADGNHAAYDMAVIARGKVAKIEHEEGLKGEEENGN